MAHRAEMKTLSTYITSVSNFSVQFNIQALSLALIIMSTSECTVDDDACKSGEQSDWVLSTSQVAIFMGAISGQLSMGYLGDVIGRNQAMKLTVSFVAVGALGSSLLSFGSPEAVYAVIILFRFLLGVGVGGVYPLSATKAAEDAGSSSMNGKDEVNSVASAKTFFWQAPGQVGPAMLGLMLAHSPMPTESKWRFVMGIGALPALMVVALNIYEEQKEKKYVMLAPAPPNKDPQMAAAAKPPQPTIWECLQDPENKQKLIVSGGGWFLYDVCFYGMELFSPYILDEISGDDDNVSSEHSIYEKCWRNAIAFSLGIPACILTIYMMHVGYSLRFLQIFGFIIIAVSFVLLACLWEALKEDYPDALYGIYCILLFALSFGPNTTTFTLPATMYPKEIRSTMNGVSAAMGKFGAVVGVYLFSLLADVMSYQVIMVGCTFVALLGAYITWRYLDPPPTHRESEVSVDDINNPIGITAGIIQ